MKKILCLILILAMLLSISASALTFADNEIKNYLKPKFSPLDGEPKTVTLTPTQTPSKQNGKIISLNGKWDFNFGTSTQKPTGDVEMKYSASVPSSIYTALVEAGKIDDPYIGRNQLKAKTYSSRYFYFQKTFDYNGDGKNVRLCFDGIADRCNIYLNGENIGSHQGMFGGPYIDVSGKLKQGENILWIELKPAIDYTQTVVYNCSYGWHYGILRPLGIWNDVYLEDLPAVEVDSPFITTLSHETVTMDYAAQLINHTDAAVKGKLTVTVSPLNFDGAAYTVTVDATAEKGTSAVRLRFDIPEGKLWWPNTVGEQNLYTLTTEFTADGTHDEVSSEFGIRTLTFEPFPGGENAGSYNRTICINGKKIFLKGAGWCTIDEMMRFELEDYDRIIKRAYEQGVNFFRAWGGGMPETDEFYSLCNKYGICVYQEWPCCWDSSKSQPADVLYETVTLNTKRIRNNPSLAVYGGGNEGVAPFSDTTLNNMGRLTYEYDGTRPFWRQDGGNCGGGISHDHIHWGGQSPEHYATAYANLTNLNMHEYGLDSMMNLESVKKYATDAEIAKFPIDSNGTIAHHTATFNGGLGWNPTPYGYDIDTFIHYASDFIEVDSVEDMIIGSQLAQTMADYLAAANSRTNFPDTSAVIYYKMNDVYPGGSWAVVDWYGAPKIAHWFLQDSYAPLTAVGKFDRYNTYDKADTSLTVPIFLLDDGASLTSASKSTVTVRAYNAALNVIKEQKYEYTGAVSAPEQLGDFTLTSEQTENTPMFVVIDLNVDGKNISNYYVPMNFDKEQGCLFTLPRTTLEISQIGNEFTVKNTGKNPAVGVNILCPTVSDKVTLSDNYFWLGAGESKVIKVSSAEGIEGVSAFNAADNNDITAPASPTEVKIVPIDSNSAKVEWKSASDDTVIGYTVYANGEFKTYTTYKNTSVVITDLNELTEYKITVTASDKGGNTSAASESVSFKTSADNDAAVITSVNLTDENTLILNLSRSITKSSAENTGNYRIDGTTVNSAVLSENGLSVTLKTDSDIENGKAYITMAGVRDNSKTGNISYSYMLINSTLKCELKLDETEGKTAAETSGGFQADTVLNNVSWAEGVRGNCAVFNGNATAALGKTALNADSLTVSMWIKADKYEGYNILFAKNNKVSGHFEVYTQNGMLKCYMPDTTDTELKIDLKKYIGKWTHLSFVFDNGKLTVYVDGKAQKTANVGVPSAVEADFAVGSLVDQSLGFVGCIDEVMIHSIPLTEAQVKSVMNNERETKLLTEQNVYSFSTEDSGFKLSVPEGAAVKSLNDEVVTVSSDGSAVIKSAGTAVIEISSNGKYDLICVSVAEPSAPETSSPETNPGETVVDSTVPAKTPQGGSNTVTVIIIVSAVVAVLVVAVIVIAAVKKKQKR